MTVVDPDVHFNNKISDSCAASCIFTSRGWTTGRKRHPLSRLVGKVYSFYLDFMFEGGTMRNHILSGTIFGSLFLAACAGGQRSTPDVGLAGIDLAPVTVLNGQPVYNSGANSFCIIDGNKLKVSVVNGGNIPTGTKAVVVVTFFVDNNPVVPPDSIIPVGFAPFILSGAFESLEFDIPDGCFHSDCRFTISVDKTDNVSEIFENNNEVDGICIG